MKICLAFDALSFPDIPRVRCVSATGKAVKSGFLISIGERHWTPVTDVFCYPSQEEYSKVFILDDRRRLVFKEGR